MSRFFFSSQPGSLRTRLLAACCAVVALASTAGAQTAPYVSPYAISLPLPSSQLTFDFAQRLSMNPSDVPTSSWYLKENIQSWQNWGPWPAQYPALADYSSRTTEYLQQRLLAGAQLFIGDIYQHHHIPQWNPYANGYVSSPTTATNYWPWLAVTYGSGTAGLDCSDYTSYAYNFSLGIKLISATAAQGEENVLAQAQITPVPGPGGVGKITPQLIPGPNNGTTVANTPAQYAALIAQFQPGDLLFIRNMDSTSPSFGQIVHVIIWLGQYGTLASGAASPTPLILNSHDNTPIVTDANGNVPPPGIHILPFRDDNWFFQGFDHALRYISPEATSGYSVPLQTVSNGGSNHLAVYAGLNGGELKPYLLDSGSPNMFATYGPWFPGTVVPGPTTPPGALTFTFADGISYNYNPVNVSVTLGDPATNTGVVTAENVNIAQIMSINSHTAQETYQNFQSQVASTGAAFTNGTYGNFGAGLYGTNSLATVLAQVPLPAGLRNGFIIRAGATAGSTGELVVGLTNEAIASFPMTYTMDPTGVSLPNPEGNPVTVQGFNKAQVANTVMNLTSGANTYTSMIPTVFDTGGGDTNFIYQDPNAANPVPPVFIEGGATSGAVNDGVSFTLSGPTAGTTFLQYNVGTTPAVNATKVAAGLDLGTRRINPGIMLFYMYDVMFDLEDGILGLAPKSQPTGIATATTLSGSPNPSINGNPATFVATVIPQSAASGLSGRVQFYDGATLLGSGMISGSTASLAVNSLSTGAHIITATFVDPAGVYNTSTSPAFTETVTANSGPTPAETYRAIAAYLYGECGRLYSQGQISLAYYDLAYYYYFLYYADLAEGNSGQANLNQFYENLAIVYYLNYQAVHQPLAAYAWYNYLRSFEQPAP